MSIKTPENQKSACTVGLKLMHDVIFTFESFINYWGDLIGMGSIEDHKGFGALHPQFWRAGTASATSIF